MGVDKAVGSECDIHRQRGSGCVSENLPVEDLVGVSPEGTTPFSPPSGLAQRLFQEPTAKSKFLAVQG